MFFGIKQLKVYTDGSALNQQLFFSSDNYTDLATSFSA
jgi:methionine salvage enolase-phosphatase E1